MKSLVILHWLINGMHSLNILFKVERISFLLLRGYKLNTSISTRCPNYISAIIITIAEYYKTATGTFTGPLHLVIIFVLMYICNILYRTIIMVTAKL
jgi:hypothetical protein